MLKITSNDTLSMTQNGKTKGFDGHSLRAAHYFRDLLPDIDLNDPYSVNRLKREDHPLRQDSKAPTFLLTLNLASFTGDSNEKLL